MGIVETDPFTLEQQHWLKLANLLEQQLKGLKTKVAPWIRTLAQAVKWPDK